MISPESTKIGMILRSNRNQEKGEEQKSPSKAIQTPTRELRGDRSPRLSPRAVQQAIMSANPNDHIQESLRGRTISFFKNNAHNPSLYLFLSWTALATTLLLQTAYPCSEKYPGAASMEGKKCYKLDYDKVTFLYTYSRVVAFVFSAIFVEAAWAPVTETSRKVYNKILSPALFGLFFPCSYYNSQPCELVLPNRLDLQGKVCSEQSFATPAILVQAASLMVCALAFYKINRPEKKVSLTQV